MTADTVLGLFAHVYLRVLPSVRRELKYWRARAWRIPDRELRVQALASLDHKAFHCEGGAIYARTEPRFQEHLIELIVSYQTLVDYLDNLCDRTGTLDSEGFARLHGTLLEALSIDSGSGTAPDAWAWIKQRGDAEYLLALIQRCRERIEQLAHYREVVPMVAKLVTLYSELQVLKHGPPAQREQDLLEWWERSSSWAPHLRWYEFAAAAGSTLGVFHLLHVASADELSESSARAAMECYFRWLCPLHILLDYLVDQEEDCLGGDLNFVAQYAGNEDAIARFQFLIAGARESVQQAGLGDFHSLVIESLLAVYLSDPKLRRQPEARLIARHILSGSSLRLRILQLASRAHWGGRTLLQPPATTQ